MSETIATYQIGRAPEHGLADLLRETKEIAEGKHSMIDFPWRRLSSLLGGGMRPGQVTLLAGSPGRSKTLLALQLALHVHRAGYPWRFMPCEDRHKDVLLRFNAIIDNDWTVLSREQEIAKKIRRSLLSHGEELSKISRCITVDPRTPVAGYDDRQHIPTLPWQEVTKWIEEEAKACRLIIVDPITMLDFASEDGRRPEWQGQQAFIREVVGVLKDTNCHVVLVCHLSKRNVQAAKNLSADDIQGSTAFTRFTHNVLMLESHEQKEAEVFRSGYTDKIDHNRTLYLAKTRYGPGTGKKIAYVFGTHGPCLEELGIITPLNHRGPKNDS